MTSDRTVCVSPSSSCVVDGAAMHRSKTSSGPSSLSDGGATVSSVTPSRASTTARRILPKSWRSKQQGKSAPCSPAAGTGNKAFWTPEASNTWCNNISGSRVVLSPASLLHLTEIERPAAQKAALARLQCLDLGLKINIPKEWTSQKTKKSRFLLKRRVAGSSTALDSLPDSYAMSSKESSSASGKVGSGGVSSDGSSGGGGGSGWVFGVPLAKCIANDAHLRRGGDVMSDRPMLSPLNTPQPTLRNRKSSSSSGGAISCDDSESESSGIIGGVMSGVVSRSSIKSKSAKRRSSLLDALLLSPSTARRNKVVGDQDQFMTSSAGSQLLVPYVVTTCCNHLQTYGLRVLGIFRIGSSKKRTTQLREEFDTGREVTLTEDHNPHEVAALLKEFFRDLPDPLLTRDLYSAFVATRKLKSLERRIEAVNLLIALLPVSNRDTLWALLTFLNLVSKHSTDSLDEHGRTLPGNKMDAHNLATLFGPNILHKAKGGALQFQVESQERAEERVEVIEVVKEMIEHQASIFALSAELHDETLRLLMNTNPEVVDRLLRSRTVNLEIDADQESTSSIYDLDVDSGSAVAELHHSPAPARRYKAAPPSPGRAGTLIETLQPPPAGLLSGRSLVEVLQVHAASLAAAARSQPKGGCPSALVGAVLGGVDMSLTAVAIGGQPSSAASTTGSNSMSSAPSSSVTSPISRRCPEMRICITADSPEYSRRHQALSSMPSTLVTSSTDKPSTSSSSAAKAPLAVDEIDALGSPRPRAHHLGRRSSGVPHGSIRSFEKQKQQQQQSIQARRQQGFSSSSSRQFPQHTLTVPTGPSSRLDRDSGTSSAGSTGYSSRGSSVSPSPSPEPLSPMTSNQVDRRPQRTSSTSHDGGSTNCSTASPSVGGRSLSTQRPLGVLRSLQLPGSDNGLLPLQSDRGGPKSVDEASSSSSRGCNLHQQPTDLRRWDCLAGHHRQQTARADELHEQHSLV